MANFTALIPQNTAPNGVDKIGVYNEQGYRIGAFGVGSLAFPNNIGSKLYSFGALSDIHISQDTAEADFRRALTYLNNVENVDFICTAGDLTQYGYYNGDDEFNLYNTCVNECSPNTTVYTIAGNHDCYGNGMTDAKFQQYTGYKTFYTFTKGNDVFIMLSQIAWPSVSSNIQPYSTSGLQSLYNALETNRNKRCFVFLHNFPWGKSGDPFELYSSNALWSTQGTVIYSLMEHYPNALWFHGHSHQTFETQLQHEKANYDFDFGCHSIHIPSCALPIDIVNGTRVTKTEGSQGYVVDVYNNAVVLRGRDFKNEKFIPVAMYCLDTTLKTVSAGTYTDSTGTITI